MFDDVNLGAAVLANPAIVQGMVITELQNRLNGTVSVADPNNAFNLQLEASASINAQTVRYMTTAFEAEYPVRATTMNQLYRHMSDFDYLLMVATPAPTTLFLRFDTDYLIANAVSDPNDALNNLVVIPATSQFFVGSLTFGIYYPINISINKTTGNFSVLWDATVPNPLSPLSSNMVPFLQYNTGGLNLIQLQIPVAQFALTSTLSTVVAQAGYIHNISYTDQFYAARVFTNLPTGQWTELAATLSETVYDPTVPTAKLVIQNDVNILTVSIPQIYFNNNQIGNQVRVDIYTTKGAITLNLNSVTVSNCNCTFNLNAPGTPANAMILAALPTIDLLPDPTLTTIVGGSNALSFPELRNLIINGGLYTGVPITPAELTTYAQKQGFSITKYLDNVTNRIYYASNTITGGANGYIMAAVGNISVTPTATNPTATILSFPANQAVTILPTTIYSFNPQTKLCIPLTDSQVTALTTLTGQALADELNTRSYTKCPFHLVTYTAAQFPETKSFNLMNPEVAAIRFIADNVFLIPQMAVQSAVVIHQANGTGGYTLRLGVTKNPAMTAISESAITVYLSAPDINNQLVYGIATLAGTTASLFIYELAIPTNYYISAEGAIRSTMTVVGGSQTTTDLKLTTTFTVTFLLNPNTAPQVAQDTNLIAGIPTPFNNNLAVSQQQLDVVLGVDLSTQVYNITNATWSSTTFATYPTTVFKTYPTDVYATNSQGGLLYTITGDVINLTKLHSAGDVQLDANGNQIVLFPAGAIKLDPFGNPVVLATRQLQYFVSSLMFDLRLFYSQNQADLTFVQNLTSNLAGYFATIATISGNLLEQTSLFYVPNNTMGTAQFGAGNNTPISLNLGFSFKFVIYTTQATLNNPVLQTAITQDVINIVQQAMRQSVISLTEIAQTIKTTVGSAIVSVDIEGIDGTQTLQTVIVPTGTDTPIVAQQLVFDVNTGTLALALAVVVSYLLAS